MAKKPSKSGKAPAVGAAVARPRKPLGPAQQDLVDRIQPALKLSELHKASEAMDASSERLRASLQLPLAEQATGSAAIASDALAAAVSRIPALVEHGSALPSARTERPNDSASSVAITSVHDLGQLVREAREQRKLSQQAFADLAGVGRRFISELENGKATLEFDKVLQVASATGIDLLARRRR
jgi:y4mF family transcriptional regulator